MKVLLTGYSGLLGRHLARALKRENFFVRVLAHQQTVPRRIFREEADEILWGSIAEPKVIESAIAEIDYVIHSAWRFSQQTTQRPTVNEIATERLLKACIASGVKRFAFISSLAVYGMRPAQADIVTEASTLAVGKDLEYIYPVEKISIERLMADCKAKETKFGVFRPGPLFDEHKPPMKAIVWLGRTPFAVGFGNGRNHMPFIHADDVADAVVRWLRNSSDDIVVNLTPTICLRHKDWYLRWGAANGLDVRPFFIRGIVLRVAAKGADYLKQVLGKPGKVDVRYAIASASRDLTYSNKVASDRLGWTPKMTDKVSDGQTTHATEDR